MKHFQPLCLLVGSWIARVSSEQPGVECSDVHYMENGDVLHGYACKSSATSVEEMRKIPAVVVLHDADGIGDYEKYRMNMISEPGGLGYFSFAADIYGEEGKDFESREEMFSLLNSYRSNVTRYVSRIQAAVNQTKLIPGVDPDKIALVGYCFGGTGALAYALEGFEDVAAVVSFHGGLKSGIPEPPYKGTKAKVLVQSGGDDDTSTRIESLELSLNISNATWEINRYSDVQHAFTNPEDSRYNKLADLRSWESMEHFLRETFDEIDYESNMPSDSTVQAFNYSDESGEPLSGYISYPSNDLSSSSKYPVVIAVHDWDGPNTYEKQRIKMLSDMGYVGIAADFFGDRLDRWNSSFQDRRNAVMAFRSDPSMYVSKLNAVIKAANELDFVNSEKLVVMGWCFGGTAVIQYAMSGGTALGVVSFHGGLTSLVPENVTITPRLLIESGGEDDTSTSIDFLENALNTANATWEIGRYSNVVHGFTNPKSPQAYNLEADVRSWRATKTFLEEVFDGSDISEPSYEEEEEEEEIKFEEAEGELDGGFGIDDTVEIETEQENEEESYALVSKKHNRVLTTILYSTFLGMSLFLV